MIWEAWTVCRRDNGQHLGTHILHRRVTEARLRECVDAWSDSGPVCLFNKDTGEVFY